MRGRFGGRHPIHKQGAVMTRGIHYKLAEDHGGVQTIDSDDDSLVLALLLHSVLCQRSITNNDR